MRMRPFNSSRGFTLVELMVSMSLAMIVMGAVFSTYLYLGRNLTRLSYRSTLESQSRKILNVFASDIRNATSVTNPTATSLTLKMRDGSMVMYAYSSNKLTRDADGSGPASALDLNYDINGSSAKISVDLLPPPLPSPNNKIFRYYTTSGGNPVSQFTSPDITPMSIKQVALNFTLETGNAAMGTRTSFPVASGRMPLVNRSLPNGN